MYYVTVIVVGLVAGFALGHFVNASKFSAIETELDSEENSVVAEVKSLVARIRAKL